MLYCTFVLYFRCRGCSDQHGQWIPFTVVIVTYFVYALWFEYIKTVQYALVIYYMDCMMLKSKN
jgi:hypothetical protein